MKVNNKISLLLLLHKWTLLCAIISLIPILFNQAINPLIKNRKVRIRMNLHRLNQHRLHFNRLNNIWAQVALDNTQLRIWVNGECQTLLWWLIYSKKLGRTNKQINTKLTRTLRQLQVWTTRSKNLSRKSSISPHSNLKNKRWKSSVLRMTTLKRVATGRVKWGIIQRIASQVIVKQVLMMIFKRRP